MLEQNEIDDRLHIHIHIISIIRLQLNVGTYFIVLRAYVQVSHFLNFAFQYFVTYFQEHFAMLCLHSL